MAIPGRVTRREALAALAATLVSGWTVPGAAHAETGPDLLGLLVDTILPADDSSPAATALGVDRELREAVAGHAQLERLFALGLGWLDAAAGLPFADLPQAARLELLHAAAASDYNQVPGRFVHVVRTLAVAAYYGRADSYAGLPLNPAPQPLGHPPPWP